MSSMYAEINCNKHVISLLIMNKVVNKIATKKFLVQYTLDNHIRN